MDVLLDISGKTLLITGIHGFLGAHAAVIASQSGAHVLGVDLPGGSLRGERIRSSLGGKKILLREANLSDYQAWLNIFKESQPDIIIHLAGTTTRDFSVKDWTGSINGNFLTTSSMVQAVVSLPERQRPVVVYPGSQMEYGISPMPWTEETLCRPFNPYGASKLASTDLLLSAERADMFRACVARFSILYGPAQSPTMFIPELISKALAGVDFQMTEGRQRRRFLYVADAASCLLNLGARLLKREKLPSLINMPASEPKSMREVAELIVNYMSNPVNLEIGAIPSRTHEVLESWPDDSRAKVLGLSCDTSLKEGLEKTIQWYRANPWFLKADAY